jgi:hypothetical protein
MLEAENITMTMKQKKKTGKRTINEETTVETINLQIIEVDISIPDSLVFHPKKCAIE